MNLQASLLQEYRQHPSFRFEDTPLLLNDSEVDSFNDSYRQLLRYAPHLAAGAFGQASAHCLGQLSRAFGLLRSQATNPLELRFFAELEAEAVRLLSTEIRFIRLSTGNRSSFLADPAALGHAQALGRDYHLFGRLDSASLAAISELALPAVANLRQTSAAGARTRDALSITSGPVVRGITSILNQSFGQQGLLDAVSAYAGYRMKVSGLALELSVPQNGWWKNRFSDLVAPPRTLYAHLDESIDHPKSIVYLSDVGPDQGPTGVYPQAYQSMGLTPLQELIGRIIGTVGQSKDSPLYAHYDRQYHQSMSSENFRRHYMRLPEAMRFNSHFGWDVLPGGQVEQFLVNQERQMLGPAGTFVIFDGARLLHRGGLMDSGERIALQVIFSDAHLGRRIMRRLKKGNTL